MLSFKQSYYTFVLCVLISSTTSARRSRIDMPSNGIRKSLIDNSPTTDNIATASELDISRVPAPPSGPANMPSPPKDDLMELPSPLPVSMFSLTSSEENHSNKNDNVQVSSSATAASVTSSSELDTPNSSGQIEDYCDPDMISFEIVTG